MRNPVILASGEAKYQAKFAAHVISFATELIFFIFRTLELCYGLAFCRGMGTTITKYEATELTCFFYAARCKTQDRLDLT